MTRQTQTTSKSLEHPGISLVCVSCLIDDHPEIGRGLGLAREHGVADLDETGARGGRWGRESHARGRSPEQSGHSRRRD